MAKKKKAPPSAPSKAYLVSFGDTMTALLAFFIVINSMAKEQTGANLYSGTGSFVSAVDSIGIAGNSPHPNSQYPIQKTAPSPLYALSENLEKSDDTGNIGPDDENDIQRKIDRDKENFQRFLNEVDRQFGLSLQKPVTDQVVFDSFELFNDEDEEGILSDHAIQLGSEIFPTLRDKAKNVEIIVWATMPSPVIINKFVRKTHEIRKEIESKFWIREQDKNRIRYTVKPWLFSDAKRPVISFVVGRTN